MRRIFFLIFFLTQSPLLLSQKYEKELDIAERYFEEGYYNKALERTQITINRLKKSRKGLAVVQAQMQSLKYLIATGEYAEFEAILAKVLKRKSYKGENHPLYAKAVLDASSAYLYYSDIVTAENYLILAEDILKEIQTDKDGNLKIKDTYFNFTLLLNKAKVLYARGKYTEALTLLPLVKKIAESRIVAKEIYFNEASLRYEEHKLNNYQLKRRKRTYCKLLLLEANINRGLGDYELAERGINDAELWIKINLNLKDPAYIDLQYAKGLLLIDKEASTHEIRKFFEKLLFLAEKKLSLVHDVYIDIQETLIDHYITTYHHRSKIEQWEIRTNTSKYYGKENTRHVLSARLDAKKAYFNKDFDEATSILEALHNDEKKVPHNHQEFINIKNQLYDLSLANEKYDEAISHLYELKKAQQNIIGEDALAISYTDMRIANFLLNYTPKFEEAYKIIRKTFYEKIAKTITPTHKDYVTFLHQHADFHELMGKYQRAKELHEQVLGITKEKFGSEHIKYASALNRLVNLELTMGEFNQADANINTMLNVFEHNFDKKIDAFAYSQALETAARYYALMGLFQVAERFLDQSKRYYDKTVNAKTNSSAVDELAYLYVKTERFKQAEDMLLEVIQVRKERYGDSSRFLINPYNQLARLSQIHGDYPEAEELVNKAQKIAETFFGDSAYQVIESLIIHAEIDNAIGDYEGAENLLKQAINIEKVILGENHIQLADTYSHLALTRLYNGANLTEVEQLMQQALNIIEENLGKENPIYAEALKNLALVNTENNKLDEALTNLETSNNIWINRLGTEINTNSAEIELLLGDVDLRKGDFQEAQYNYKSAKNIYKKIFNKQHPAYVKSVASMGRGFYMLGKFKRAKKYTEEVLNNYTQYINEFFPALSEREKARFWSKIREDFEFFNNLTVDEATRKKRSKLTGLLYNNTMSTKSLLLSSSIKVRNQILNSNDSTLIANYNAWIDKKELLTKVLAMNHEQQKESKLDPKYLEKEIEEIEKELSNNSSLFDQSTHHKVSDWRALQKELQEGEAAIEIVRYRYFDKSFSDSVIYAALIIKPKIKQPEMVILPKGNFLESNYLKYYRYCIIYNIEDENSYNYFWKPIHDKLPESTKIYLSTEGVYNQVNLEAILHPDGKFIIDHNDIVLLGNTADLLEENQSDSKGLTNNEIALFGNPVFYRDLQETEFTKYNNRQISQLPGTEYEVVKLDSLLKSEMTIQPNRFVNKTASEENVKALQNPKIFHIATHGFFMPDEENQHQSKIAEKATNNPLLRSGLLLTNAGDLMENGNVYTFNKHAGVLTAYEAMSLNLDNTELVVLSACETGRGENKVGEGVYGLQRSFLVAGAQSIIMSLFKVSDEATQELMVNFYKNWLSENMEKRTAFREAKRSLMAKFRDPLFWGAFVMVGSK